MCFIYLLAFSQFNDGERERRVRYASNIKLEYVRACVHCVVCVWPKNTDCPESGWPIWVNLLNSETIMDWRGDMSYGSSITLAHYQFLCVVSMMRFPHHIHIRVVVSYMSSRASLFQTHCKSISQFPLSSQFDFFI